MESSLLTNLEAEMARRKAMTEIKLKSIKEIASGKFNPEQKEVSLEDYEKRYMAWINKQIQCPERFAHADPENLPREVKEWLKTFDGTRGLYLYGGVGTGKTYAMWALAKLLYANEVGVRARNVVDWLDHLRSQYDKSGNSEYEIGNELRTKELLILDDTGAEKSTDWTTEIMYRLLNTRYETVRPTFIATNLSMADTAKKYGDRVASRLVEMCDIVKLDGADRREK